MSGMNQEDVLRELELLPVWQSRAPAINKPVEAPTEDAPLAEALAGAAPSEVPAPEIAPEVITSELKPEVLEQKPEPALVSEPEKPEAVLPSYQFRCIASEDTQWLFVLQKTQSAEAETLLQNMIKAVSVKVGQDVEQADAAAVNQFVSKVIVVMGEEAAQQLLTVTDSLAALRGYPHELNDIPVIATYSPDALLENLSDKSKAWEDLCLAKFTIANL